MASARFCERNGVKIRYEVRGRGEPLALIMGYSGSGKTWGEPFLRLIERNFSTIVIDNRGTGESDKPDVPWTVGDMAADAAAVLDHAGIQRAHVMGISMGGMIAQEFALDFAAKLRGLVLGCTLCGLKHAVLGEPEATDALIAKGDLPPAEQARKLLIACSSKAFGGSPQGLEFIEARIKEMEGYPLTPLHSYHRQWEAISAFDTYDRLDKIAAPTLVVTGTDDPIVPAQNSAILRERIPGAQLHSIDGAGHLFFWEAPEESAASVSRFLAKH
ncbi:MAG TPA: alpha/beta fold hydrolase [Candidatus Binataceae bacterium]|nr:alpha/beta fold hydrolase [Candidatus Binataceae bacterium]